MRAQDVLHPYLDGIDLVVESHSGSLSMKPYLNLPAGVVYERRTGRGDLREAAREAAKKRNVLELAIFGPDLELHGPESEALYTIRRLEPGERCAILFGYQTHALPFHRLLDDLTAAHAQVLQVSALEYDHIHAVAIVAASDRLAIPRDLLGEPLAPDADREPSDPAFFRIANEFVFTDFVLRNVRAQLYRDASGTGWPTAQTSAQVDLDLARAKAEAERAWTEAERAQAEAERLARSTSYRFGRAVIETARGRRPITGLPRALVRAWRRSRRHDGGPATGPSLPRPRYTAGAGTASTGRGSASWIAAGTGPTGRAEDRLFLTYSAAALSARTRPVVLGILSDPTAGALAADAIVNRITPNDAILTLERSEPDLLLVESAALAGSHPWAFAANAAAVERTSLLIELIDGAHGMGRPAVLVRDVRSPDHVGLIPLESRFDLVIDAAHGIEGSWGWSRGVQLASFNPVGAATRDERPRFTGGLDPRTPIRERRFVEAVLAAGREHGLEIGLDPDAPADDALPEDLRQSAVGRISRAGLAPLYRRTSLIIANPFTEHDPRRTVEARTLEQLACGARVVSGPNAALEAVAGPNLTVVRDVDEAAMGLAKALDAGAPTAAAMRDLLRTLFLGHASPVMLSQITRRLKLSVDPLSSRSITAIVALGPDADVDSIVESITYQIQVPTRTVILLQDGATWPAAADTALAAAGIEVQVRTAAAIVPDWSWLEDEATTEWLGFWPQRRPVAPAYLLDLLIGGEMSRPSAVGYQRDEGWRFVPSLDLASAIVRRGAAGDVGGWQHAFDADPSGRSAWERHGRRFLSVGPEDVT